MLEHSERVAAKLEALRIARPDHGPLGPGRFGAVDVHYPKEGGARAALVVADDPTFATLVHERVALVAAVAPYEPGSFWKRELPAIESVVPEGLSLLVIDGYVDLDAAGRPGLGAYVHDALGVPVIGVAKTAFRGADHAAEVRRGTTRPLYVTVAGLTLQEGAEIVRSMVGPHRLPDALRRVDALARGREEPGLQTLA